MRARWLFKHANAGPAINWPGSRAALCPINSLESWLTKNTPARVVSAAGCKTRVSADVHDYYAIWAGALSSAPRKPRQNTTNQRG